MRWLCSSFLAFAVFSGCEPLVIDTPSSSSSTSGGMGGQGGGAIVSAPPECVNDSDCTLVDTCCTCLGIPNQEPVPECTLPECAAPKCEANGLLNPATVCRASHCVLDADCNRSHASCKSLPPDCPPGKTIFVVDGCWGGCIDVAECREVQNCAQCLGGQACVTSNTMMFPAVHCVTVPNTCNGQISCACMGQNVCGFGMGCMQVSPTELKCLDITTK